MAFNRLTTAEMVSTSKPWVTSTHDERQALLAAAVTAGLVPMIEGAHQGLLDTHQVIAVRQAALSDALSVTDGDFDALARGLWFGFHSAINLALVGNADPARVAALQELQARVFPYNLQIVQRSYREEAGQVELLASRLTAADEALLATIPVAGGTALDVVRQWIEAGIRLGALEDERAALKHAAVTPADGRRARNHWIRVIGLVRSVLELTAETNPAAVAILDRLREVERQSAARRAGSTSAAASDDTDDGSETADTDESETADPGDDRLVDAPVADDAASAALRAS